MKCQEQGCKGVIDPQISVNLQVSCHSTQAAYPCGSCGRLHWHDGQLVFNRQDQRAFFREGAIVHLDTDGAVIIK